MGSATVSLLLQGFGVNEECTLSPRRLQTHLSSDYAPSSLYKVLVHPLRLSVLLFSPSGMTSRNSARRLIAVPLSIACKDVTAVLLAINEISNWVGLGRHHDAVPLELSFCHDLNPLLWHPFSNVVRWDLK
jgi:hypothetical protein